MVKPTSAEVIAAKDWIRQAGARETREPFDEGHACDYTLKVTLGEFSRQTYIREHGPGEYEEGLIVVVNELRRYVGR
jgi:hypothetical protein